MDHLPLPHDPVLLSIAIRFVCEEEYDYGEFSTFPQRKGWSIAYPPSGSISFAHNGETVTDHGKIATMLQTWLYFGLLSDVIGSQVPMALFRKETETGNLLLFSAHLGPIIGAWTEQSFKEYGALETRQLQDWKDAIYRTILDARDVVLRTVHFCQNRCSCVLIHVCLSISVLGEYLIRSLIDICLKKGLEPPTRPEWQLEDIADTCKPLVDTMKQIGWCPNQLAAFDRQEYKSIGMLWYYANMIPPEARDGHQNCTASKCISSQVNLREYETLRRCQACTCSFQGPSSDSLADMIMSGFIPLIGLRKVSANDGDELNLRKWLPKDEFVAISHVWADGKGNLLENSLPHCVLRDLQDCVNALPRRHPQNHMPFWMDTLCLPRMPLELRRRGLLTFSDAFKNATHVLVIDTYLRNLCVSEMEPVELIARIGISKWNQRLWTLSEGRLGTSIWFQFRDRAINLVEIMEPWRAQFSYVPCLPSNDVYDCILGNYSTTTLFSGERYRLELRQIPDLRSTLSTRATSWKYDEALCLGNIMSLDMNAIINAADEQKMQTFWSLVEKIPVGLAFSQARRKLVNDGYRWAPSSLTGEVETKRWGGSRETFGILNARPSADGLLVDLLGLLFIASGSDDVKDGRSVLLQKFQQSNPFFIKGRSGRWYECSNLLDWHQQPVLIDPLKEEPAIIFEEPLDPSKPLFQNDHDPIAACRALLVTYSSPKPGEKVIRVKAHKHALFSVLPKSREDIMNILEGCNPDIWNRHHDDIIHLEGSRFEESYRSWVEDYARGKGLLGPVKDMLRYREFDHSEKAVIDYCIVRIAELEALGAYCKVQELPSPITWCID